MIHIPMYDEDVPLGRDQFEQLARPILAATVTATRAAIAAARLTPADIAGVFLVGGGSRNPTGRRPCCTRPSARPRPRSSSPRWSSRRAASARPPRPAPPGRRWRRSPARPFPARPSRPRPRRPRPVRSRLLPRRPRPVCSRPRPRRPRLGVFPPRPRRPRPVRSPAAPPGPVSGSGAIPVSVPMPAAPVSPGFSATPVSGQPSTQFGQDSGYAVRPAGPIRRPPRSRPLSTRRRNSRSLAVGRATRRRPDIAGATPPPHRRHPRPRRRPAARPCPRPPTGRHPPAQSPTPDGQRRTRVLAAVAVVLLLLVGLGIYGLGKLGDDDSGKDQTSSQTEGPRLRRWQRQRQRRWQRQR